MTSITPQGGGEAPKNISGRMVVAIWWIFGFIIIACYTANLGKYDPERIFLNKNVFRIEEMLLFREFRTEISFFNLLILLLFLN